MSKHRSTTILLVLIALLLLANLARPLLQPDAAFAQEEEKKAIAITGSGASAWILRGEEVYYLKYDHQSNRIDIVGPEQLY